jgi:hypothetical protein
MRNIIKNDQKALSQSTLKGGSMTKALLFIMVLCCAVSAATFTDDFSQGDTNPLLGNYIRHTGFDEHWKRINGKASATGEYGALNLYNAKLDSNVSVRINVWGRNNIGVVACCSSSTVKTFYLLRCYSGYMVTQRFIAGTATELASVEIGASANGDSVKMKISHDTLFCYYNSTLKSTIYDANIKAGGYCGIYQSGSGWASDSLDNLYITELTPVVLCDTAKTTAWRKTGAVGMPYSWTRTFTYSADSAVHASLPSGLTENKSTGTVSGTPNTYSGVTVSQLKVYSCAAYWACYDTFNICKGVNRYHFTLPADGATGVDTTNVKFKYSK